MKLYEIIQQLIKDKYDISFECVTHETCVVLKNTEVDMLIKCDGTIKIYEDFNIHNVKSLKDIYEVMNHVFKK